MDLKKIARRGLVGLAIAVALCMFFAGTVRTITTAKVKMVSPKHGRLEQTIDLLAQLHFPSSVEYRIEEAAQLAMLIDKVNVRIGYEVKAGDVLFTASLTDYQAKMDELTAKYSETLRKLSDLDLANRTLSKTSERNTWYESVVRLQESTCRKRVSVFAHAIGAQIALPDAQWDEAGEDLWMQAAVAAGAGEALLAAIASYNEEQAALAQASQKLEDSYKYSRYEVGEETWKYIVERNGYLQTMAELESQMIALTVLRETLSEIRAPSDGYIVSLLVKAGEVYDGKAVAYAMSDLQAPPVLRADITDATQTISQGAVVTVASDYSKVQTSVSEVRLDPSGKKYALIALNEDVLRLKGGVYALTLADTKATIAYRATESTTLVPASAVRSDGSEDYVFIVSYDWGMFTGERLVVQKQAVTVLGRSDKLVSIAESIYERVADKEDRAIADGDAVMEYVN